MRTATTWKVAVVGLTLAAGVAVAGGDKVRQNNGNEYGDTPRTGVASVGGEQKRDRDRDRLRDGSCKVQADQTRERKRDGSCKAQADKNRDRKRDGSCK